MPRARIENIQALRGAAALLVFAAHIKGAEIDYGGGGEALPFWLNMGVSGVDLFFLISGYVMVHVAAATDRGARAGGRFLFNRAARIYPLYWAATAGLLVLYVGKKAFFGEATPIPNPVASAFLLPSKALPVLPVGWTLVFEMYFYAVFSVFIFMPRRALPFLIGGWAAIVAGCEALGWRTTNAWTEVVFSPLVFEFIAGCAVAFFVRRGATRFGAPALSAGVAWLVVLYLGYASKIYPGGFEDHRTRAMLFLAPFALILYGAVALETQNDAIAPQWLRRAGDASYSLYLVHVPVVLVIGRLFVLKAGPGWADNLLLIGLAAIAGLLVAFAVNVWLEKPGLRLTKRLGDRLFAKPAQSAVAQDRAW